MADSLILKGVKDVRKHAGTEMMLVRPKRGGDTHQVKEWWRAGKASTVYCDCTIFDVTVGGDTVKLVLDSSVDTDVRIDHDGAFNFSFFGINEIKRAALFSADFSIIEHYVFPAISGGKIMTVTPADAAPRPDGTVAETIGTPVIAGDPIPEADASGVHYVCALSGGDASSPVYTWSTTGNATVASGQGNAAITVDFTDAGDATIDVSVSQEGASNTPQTDSFPVTITPSSPPFASLVASADVSHVVTVADTGNGDKYQIDGVEQAEVTANVGETIYFDLSDASVSGHPFTIYTDSTKTTQVTVGIQQEGDELLFTPPIPGSFSYQCSAHADMGGDITVS